MSLRGWLNTLDKFAPRCQRCNRKLRSTFKCRTCGALLCSESCAEKHANFAHAPQLKKQQAQATAAELKKLGQLIKREADAAAAEKRYAEQRRQAAKKAARRLEESLDAWRQAGSPEVEGAELDRAAQEAARCRASARRASWDRATTFASMAYPELAHFTRRAAAPLGQPWFITSMIGGAVPFTLAVLLALFITKSLGLILALGAIGFSSGFLAVLCLLCFPADDELRKSLATLGRQHSEQRELSRAAARAYLEARQRYKHLAHLYRLRTECDEASLEVQQLQKEGQATGPEPLAGLPATDARLRPGRPRHAARASGGIALVVGALCIPAVLFVACCGGLMVVDTWGVRQEAQDIAQADKLYAAGRQEEAVSLYEQHPLHLLDSDGKGLVPLRRVVEFEVAKGHNGEARNWVERALDKRLQVTFDSAAAKELQAAVQQERAEAAARKQREDEARLSQKLAEDEARRKEREQREQAARAEAESKAKQAREEQARAEAHGLADAEHCLAMAARQAWADGLRQIPATVIDKGVLRHVPYQSFRAGDYEVNVYGDPSKPAGLEIGVYGGLLRSQAAKDHCLEFMAAVLNDPADRAILPSLNRGQDVKSREGLTFEVTPETAEDAYGGWWVSVYDTAALDKSRASPQEMAAITVEKKAPEKTADSAAAPWSPQELAQARPGGKTVYVRGYTRKDGTYVRPHTRAAPGSGGGRRR